MADQRVSYRSPIDVDVEITHDGETRFGVAYDVSVGGLFIETDNPFPSAADVVVTLLLPFDAGLLSLPARVRWTQVGRMGLRFRILGAAEAKALNELLRACQPSSLGE